MTEIALFPLWITVFVTIWGLVAPLIGTLLGVWMGYYLSRSQQRRQWIADNKVKEWQELLATLATSFTTIIQVDAALVSVGDKLAHADKLERMTDNLKARKIASEVLVNRVFIARETRQLGIYKKWSNALEQLDQNHDAGAAGTEFGEINAMILAGARADIEKV
jgi:hypothetical protein